MDKEIKYQQWLQNRINRKKSLTSDVLYEGIIKGNIQLLSNAITVVESTLDSDKIKTKSLIKKCLPHAGKSIRIGITGVPGVGKSTFIESFGLFLNKIGKKVAILAIDPSSNTSGGSILGDKTRMEVLSRIEGVFIRPSPAGTTLGGVTRKTRESIILCEAAGFDVIIVETVGVGQSEIAVHSMTDFFLLLMLSGAGDELQGIKRGIMEMADALVITKADGDNVKKANLARREYQNAIHLFPPKQNDWIPKVMTCSSVNNTNIDTIWNTIDSFHNQTKLNGWFDKNRKEQEINWLKETLEERLLTIFYDNEHLLKQYEEQKNKISTSKTTSYLAADFLIQQFLLSINGNNI